MSAFFRNALCTLACLALLLPGLAGAADWPQWRGPQRDGISPETDLRTDWGADGPPVLWRKELGPACSSWSIANGRAYSMGNVNNQDIVYCFDAVSGEEIWTFAYDAPLNPKNFEGGPGCTPTVLDGRVYVVGRKGQIHCLNAEDGSPIWKRDAEKEWAAREPKWGFTPSALVDGGRAYFSMDALHALDAATGEEVWASERRQGGYSSPVVFELEGVGHCVATMDGVGLLVSKAAGGEQVLSFEWETAHLVNAATPIVHDDKVFLSSGYNKGCALVDISAGNAKEIYSSREMRNHMTTCVLHEGKLYGFDMGALKCLDFATGEMLWEQGGFGKGAVILAGDTLIIQGEKGDVALARATPEGYREIARAKPFSGRSWVTPALANGLLYVRGNDGTSVCLDLRPANQ